MDDWKLDFQYGTFLIWPEEEVRAMANKLREKYDPESQKICDAHITLTQPLLEEPNEEAWKLIESILSNFEPFVIHFGPIEQFGSSPVVKFDVEPKDKVLAIRESLHETGLFNLTLPFTEGFIPHITITESGLESSEAASELATELNQKIAQGTFQCNEVTYVRPDESFNFKSIRSFPLNRG